MSLFNLFGSDVPTLDVNEIKNIGIENVIDIREKDEVKQNSIKGVKNIPMMGLAMNPHLFLNKNKKYYIMCASGNRSGQLCKSLIKEGYDVVSLSGGINNYKQL